MFLKIIELWNIIAFFDYDYPFVGSIASISFSL